MVRRRTAIPDDIRLAARQRRYSGVPGETLYLRICARLDSVKIKTAQINSPDPIRFTFLPNNVAVRQCVARDLGTHRSGRCRREAGHARKRLPHQIKLLPEDFCIATSRVLPHDRKVTVGIECNPRTRRAGQIARQSDTWRWEVAWVEGHRRRGDEEGSGHNARPQ
ncbi:MAG: hypothetical protein Q7W05_14145 [Deltaproteobacteria bacterium]|nr:hypothetical protein [Deltaproteobacteria bacterium]